jgi:hypothetical protein
MKRQANFKYFKRFGAFKGVVEQKKRCIQLVRVSIGLFWRPLVPKNPNLHKNSLNKLLLKFYMVWTSLQKSQL